MARPSRPIRLPPVRSRFTSERIGRFVQVHFRLRRDDAELLRRLAEEREQSQSEVLRSLLRPYRTPR